jgi:undecaprenyl diphosphate synthase
MPSTPKEPLSPLAEQVSQGHLPRHVAAIMDGNGRWARGRDLPRISGHAQGHYTVRRIVDLCGKIGIPYLTLYAFSVENWRRPADEVAGLMSLIENVAHEEIESLHEENVRFNIIGRMHELPDGLRTELERDMELTRNNTGLTLTLAINYGGRAEIVDAVRALVASGVAAEDVTEEAISRNLYTADLPDPDLLIRTAGELRVSNYLLWQIAYTEIYVTDRLWPDFSEEDFLNAVLAYQQRTRKFGAVAA